MARGKIREHVRELENRDLKSPGLGFSLAARESPNAEKFGSVPKNSASLGVSGIGSLLAIICNYRRNASLWGGGILLRVGTQRANWVSIGLNDGSLAGQLTKLKRNRNGDERVGVTPYRFDRVSPWSALDDDSDERKRARGRSPCALMSAAAPSRKVKSLNRLTAEGAEELKESLSSVMI